jgi:hypothetical protein
MGKAIRSIVQTNMKKFKNIPFPHNKSNYIHYFRYAKFIESRPIRNLKKENRFNIHHIFPKSMGGLDNKDNLIKLTNREHFVAHLILWKCGYLKMIRAFWIMNVINKKRMKLSSRQYSILVKDKSIDASISQLGSKNHMYGKTRTEEAKRKTSEKLKGRIFTREHRNNLSIAETGEKNHQYGKRPSEKTIKKCIAKNTGKKRSQEVKNKISSSNIGKHTMSELNKEKLRQIGKKLVGNKNHFYGKHHSEKTKYLQSIVKLGKPGLKDDKNPMARPVRCKETNETFLTMKAASIKCYGDGNSNIAQRVWQSIRYNRIIHGFSFERISK